MGCGAGPSPPPLFSFSSSDLSAGPPGLGVDPSALSRANRACCSMLSLTVALAVFQSQRAARMRPLGLMTKKDGQLDTPHTPASLTVAGTCQLGNLTWRAFCQRVALSLSRSPLTPYTENGAPSCLWIKLRTWGKARRAGRELLFQKNSKTTLPRVSASECDFPSKSFALQSKTSWPRLKWSSSSLYREAH